MRRSKTPILAVASLCCGGAAWAVMGCSETGAVNEPRRTDERRAAPEPSASSAVSEPAGAVSRSALAILGYHSEEEGERAFKETHQECPGPWDGSEMLGREMPEWHLELWNNDEPKTLASLRGRVVVVRFWTSPGCPFCEKTLPALEALSKELVDEPVSFIGAFHSKPEAAYRSMTEPLKVIESWGVHFPVALDPEWKTLKSWWLDGGVHRHATSVTFVIGKDGRLLHVHPGPVFHPSDDPDEAKQNSDYLAVRAAIREGLNVAPPSQ